MATRFVDEATQQLAPVYDQQIQAQQAQLPAIQQLYDSLLTGLQGQQATENQNLLESAGQRGVLRSTIPVDNQATLGAAYIGQRGQLGAQQAKEVAGVNSNIGQLNLAKATGIQSLADTLYQRDLKEREFAMQQQAQAQDAALRAQAARSGGGKSGRAPTAAEMKAMTAQGIASQFQQLIGKDGKVGTNTWAAGLADWVASGNNVRTFWQNFGQYVNPNYIKSYSGYLQR